MIRNTTLYPRQRTGVTWVTMESTKYVLFRKKRSREHAMVGTWLAGQRPGPAEPDAGTPRPCDIRVEGRSVSGLRPDSLLRCSALGGLLTQPHRVPADGEAGWCWPTARPPVARSRPAADLYAFGQWSAAWSRLARSSRSAGP